ncbi:2-succinyl-5-enolpyruvyl-6-hydroxy-3-cyclohexene-1-carboxylic-acid synthase [Vibrio kyushuensis]|uniref:2-succinyl-5-enolpyruvyl-6-hydroxy-3- cyclohexene-1-carboxylic-acid synthase n=1 Tax=Vibrio kyushuensis TaxID=2910249 RepID=UPI003D1478B4
MAHQAVMNRIWCEVILEELTRFGVTDVCLAPGSRSTPLTLEADANSKLNIHTHFDERGLGFLALGLAKASKKPIAIIVTSGTAVANLLPAIAEAKLTGEKLVVLTADRPQQLVGCGANQAIAQQGIFSSHASAALNLPCPSDSVSLNWLLSSIDEVMHQQNQVGSAVHINCPFPEPLYSVHDKSIFLDYLSTIQMWQNSTQRYTQQYFGHNEHLVHPDLFTKKGMVIIGSVSLDEANQALELASTLGWPVLCDPQSGVSSDWVHYDLWLQMKSESMEPQSILAQCEAVVQFGSRVISKRLNHWLEKHISATGCDYFYIDPSTVRNNQSHLNQIHCVANISDWVQTQLKSLTHPNVEAGNGGWADELKALSTVVKTEARNQLESGDDLTEISLAYSITQLQQSLPKEVSFFFGNSLFVRLVDMFSSLEKRDIFTNRGASGIDGLVATSAGVQRSTQQPMILFIGDTSLLYDFNSLALFTHQETPVVVLVTNNDGGAIFDLLPVPEAQKQALYQMPHGYQFEYAAKQFGLAYDSPNTLSTCLETMTNHLTEGHGALIIEVQTPPNQASTQLKEFYKLIHAS